MINLTFRSILLFLFLGFTPFVQSAKKGKSQVYGLTGIHGHALPKWPKQADSLHVSSCEAGSPAFGKLKAGDVIIGIGDQKFTEHPVIALAKIADQCEREGEKLSLLLKSGKKVIIQLPSLGSYSSTAPYNCKKSDKIIAQAAEQLMKEKGFGSSPTRSGLLGLMATGEKKHLDVVKKFIYSSGMVDVGLKSVQDYLDTGKVPSGYSGWTWGYNLIALGEYYLLSKDEKVLPAIKIYAQALAYGQDSVGLWGHRVAKGDMPRRAPGYGIMNQPSLSNFMGMLLAVKCGIKDPLLDKAIIKTNAYVADHIGKGGFPYGVHGPKDSIFNNNGSSALAAICMALMGNKEGATHFSMLSAPTHNKLSLGHASHFFNPLWTPLGANLLGPELTQKFFKRSLWYFNGKRHWSGGFPGKEGAGYYAGQALLMYCLPRKVLFITGKGADESLWIKGNKIDEALMMSQIDYSKKSLDELLKMFNSPYSQVRVKVIDEVKNRLNNSTKKKIPDTITPKLKLLVNKGNEQERALALRSLGKSHKSLAMPNTEFIGNVLRDKKQVLSIRVAAATALGYGNCGEAAIPYYNDILKLVLEERSSPDPFGHVDNKLSRALAGIIKSLRSSEQSKRLFVDQATLYRVSKKFLYHKRQKVRSFGASLLKDIKLKDFHIIADSLIHVLENKDPSYHTYSGALNADGIKVLAKLNIKEGLDYLEYGIFHAGGKWGFKYSALMEVLPHYGANAKAYIPKFEAHKSINKKGDRFTPRWQKVVKKINDDDKPKVLISVEDAKKMGSE